MPRPARSRRLRHLAAALVVTAFTLLGGAALRPAAASAAAPTHTGWVRVGHLSPGTGPVDITLAPFGRDTTMMAARNAAYGSLTPYSSVPDGYYSITMRPAGKPSAPAVLSTNLTVQAGDAYTIAVIGSTGQLHAQVLTDDLSAPPAGRAKVRLIQASTTAGALNVRAVGGPELVSGARYGAVTGYAAVPQGRWMLDVTTAGATTPIATPTVDLFAGSVYSLLVLNKPGGGVTVIASTIGSRTTSAGKPTTHSTSATPAPRPGHGGGQPEHVPATPAGAAPIAADGSGMSVMPHGGVETGAGGTAAPRPGLSWGDAVFLAAASALLVMTGGGIVVRRLTRR